MTLSAWRTVGASVQGTSHQKSGAPCQDAHALRCLPAGPLLIAVADGAGSAARSDEGAHCAVTGLLAALAAAWHARVPTDAEGWQQLMAEAFAATRAALVQLADTQAAALHLFATTLTGVIVSDGWLTVGRIGDGFVVAELDDGDILTTIRPPRGEYANETIFLTMPTALTQFECQAEPHLVRAIAVSTDGLVRLAMRLPAFDPHRPFFDPLLQFAARQPDTALAAQELSAFLASERVCARTDDDKTLVLAVRVEAAV